MHNKSDTRNKTKLFDHYYSQQMTYERKRDFICCHIDVKPTSKRNLRIYKLNSRTYMLPVDGRLVHVCKHSFLKTLKAFISPMSNITFNPSLLWTLTISRPGVVTVQDSQSGKSFSLILNLAKNVQKSQKKNV